MLQIADMKLLERFAAQGYYVPLTLFAAALFYYPAFWVTPFHPHNLPAVTTGALALLSCAFLLFDFRRTVAALAGMRRSSIAGICVFFCIGTGHFFVNRQYPLNALGESLVWIVLPLTVYVFHEAFRALLPYFLALLGFFDLLVSAYQYHHGSLVFGIPGNTNWNAALLLVSVPFLAYKLYGFLKNRLHLPRVILLPVIGTVAGSGAWLFAACASRGATLALGIASLVFLFLRLSMRGKRILCGVVLVLALSGVLCLLGPASGWLKRFAAQEDRLVIYQSTLALIAEHPLFGVGGVSFEDAFVPFKPEDYFKREHNAVRTDHPHNDILFMTASFGIIGWLAWGFLVLFPLYICFRRFLSLSGEEKWMLFAFLCLLIHAQLDLIFVVWPLNIAALCLLGLFWRRAFFAREMQAGFHGAWCAVSVPCGIVFAAGMLFCTVRTAYASQSTRMMRDETLPLSERLMRMERSIRFAPHEYKANYAMLAAAEKAGCPELVLMAADRLAKSFIGNYAHVHGFRGGALVRLRRFEEAYDAYLRDAENYPLSLIPIYNMAVISRMAGHPERIPEIEKELFRRMKARNITPRMLPMILREPKYDRAPWDMPAEYRGSAGAPEN